MRLFRFLSGLLKEPGLLLLSFGILITAGCVVGTAQSSRPTKEMRHLSASRTKIAFASDRSGKGLMELYYMNLDGSGQTRVALPESYAGLVWDPVISPDGRQI